ncbi:MAG TPA: efflux RND transporter periplasmic adaptor subunit [Candidatus Binataceae bacterium]
MKRILRRVFSLSIIAALAVGFYFFGRTYLWPPVDTTTVKTVGMLEAQEVNITSRIAGRITRLDLIEGDRVKRGQVVCRIEDIDIRNQLNKARADLAQAQADLAEAKRNRDRDLRLFSERVISVKQRDDDITAVQRSDAAVQSAVANVKFFEDQLIDTGIRAPIDGVIVNKALETGEWVTPGTPILTVDDLSTVWARVDVEETELGTLYVGKAAQVTLPTNPPQIFSGRIMSIGQEGQFATEHDVRRGRQDIRTFYVKVQVLQAGGELKPGMTAEVTFERHDGTRLTRNTNQGPY